MDVNLRTNSSSMVICGHFLLCLIIFYTVFYMTCSVCTGAMGIDHFNWRIPFEHTAPPEFSNTDFLVHLISLEITCLICGLLFVPIGRSWVWDYSITVSGVHVCLCCIVTGVLPWMWQWWLEIGCGLILMVGFGQTLAYCTGSGSSIAHPLMFDNEEYYYS